MRVIDNINETFGDELKSQIHKGSKVRIAAAYFSIFAFEALKNELSDIDQLEFVFTSPTFVPDKNLDKMNRAHREFQIPKIRRERDLSGTGFEIQLKNKLTQRAVAKECAEWIRKKARFKSNKAGASMQSFAHVANADGGRVYTGFRGLTSVDLGYEQGDDLFSLINVNTEPTATEKYLSIFEQIWSDPTRLEDVTETLCEHISEIYKENSPERVYFLMLYNIFNEFLEDLNEDLLPNDRTGYQDTVIWNTLYKFQQDAATGLINKLETYNGCILADSVGLGKTFTALAVIKYYELRNKDVLVLCPKKLAENWRTYNGNLTTNILQKDRLRYDVLNHTDLQRTSGDSYGMPMNQINWGNYDLVVIDESHNFRNNDALKEKETRYQKLMNSVVRAGVQTKVLMLSATPVNNRFNDLKNQLALAYEDNPDALSKKLKTEKSIDGIFRNAQTAFNDWSKLPPEDRTAASILGALDFDFFKLLDSVTIARSRKHITTYYDTSEIGAFPTRRKPLSYRCALTNRPDAPSFNEIYQELSLLKLSVYAPISYVLDSRRSKYEDMYDTEVDGGKGRLKQADREKSLQSLMTVNLLKRLESSVEAFRLTLGKLKTNHELTLAKIAEFERSGQDSGLNDISGGLTDVDPEYDDVPDIEEFTIGKKIKISLADMDLESWKAELEADNIIISALLIEMQKIRPEDDLKLQHILEVVEKKIDAPFNEGNPKTLIFTAFSDTAKYLNTHISEHVTAKHGLHVACVTGGDSPKSTLKKHYDFQSILTLFSPRSKKKDLLLPNEASEITVLIGTDCISEGQNLQDCDQVVNFDIHWNPVRIIQRFGRVDRIGSTNAEIQLINYWPDISLDEYINLKDRVESRMVIADVSATGDDNVLSAKANDMSYRKEQLRRLQDEVIELEDLKTGVNITDLGLNDFRMDLVNYIAENGDLNRLPNGMHAVVPANPAKGLNPGVLFTLKNIKAGTEINRQNRLHPYYLIYIGEDGEVISDHTQVKHLLDLARAGCKGQTLPVKAVCEPFNAETQDGRRMERYSALLDQAILSMIDTKEDKDIDSLFSRGPTTALVQNITGLDDFELISFLVVRES